MTASALAPRFDFDPDALRRKYREERDKRVRPNALAQYVGMDGDLGDWAKDPHADPDFTRAPVSEEIDVLILGGGITGLMTAAALRKAGIEQFRMVDKAADFGGTWYWNRYPGVRCDVESYIYMPLLEELNYVPSEKYARGSEIFAHCRAIGRHFDLYPRMLFQTEVRAIRWDAASARWLVATDRDDVLKARFITIGTGPISKPKLPRIAGIDLFKGHQFHTARWDYAYTGGDDAGELRKLADKRVAVIGTGATGVQVIPEVARWAKETLVIQRTPSAVDVRANRPTDPEWAKTLKPGWQKERMENFSAILTGMPVEQDLVNDRWTDVWRRMNKWSTSSDPEVAAMQSGELFQMTDYQKMEELRARIAKVVADEDTAERLKPWYNLFCKRPLYSDEYFEAFNRPGVRLIDTDGNSIERLTEHGLVVNGVEYPVDCIIYASGYEIGVPTYRAGGYEIVGRDGVTLADKWAGGVATLHGMYTDEFPNMFVVGGIRQAAASINFPHMLGFQASHAAAIIDHCLKNGISQFEIKPEAVRGWADLLDATAVDQSAFEHECTPGYLNNEGDTKRGKSLFSNIFAPGIFEYQKICDAWMVDGLTRDASLTKDPGFAAHAEPKLAAEGSRLVI